MAKEKESKLQVRLKSSMYAILKSVLALKQKTVSEWVIEKIEEEIAND